MKRMKKILSTLSLVALVVCFYFFSMPMHKLCACLSQNDLLLMGFKADDMTDTQLAQAVRIQMEGFNIEKDYAAWKAAYDKKVNAQSKDVDKRYGAMPDDFFVWINWLNPEYGPPGDCTPVAPWKSGQTVSCKIYKEGNAVKKAGYRLDFRIAADGVIHEVEFYALSSLLGIETLKGID